MPRTIVDTGALLAFLDPDEPFHGVVKDCFSLLTPPLLTAEPAVTELCFLLARNGRSPGRAIDLIADGMLIVEAALSRQPQRIGELMRCYENVPMSLADACLVAMSEWHPHAEIITFDSNFHVYRRFGYEALPLVRLPRRVQEPLADHTAEAGLLSPPVQDLL